MSATRRSDRKPKANTRLNDLADSSPTGPKSQAVSKKRKASGGGPAPPSRRRRQRRLKTPEDVDVETEPEMDEDNEGDASDEEDSQELVDLIVPFLDVNTNEPVLAAEEHANSKVTENGRKDITAYAKICGREWTYYVRDAKITFGREPDKNDESKGETSDPPVSVDLGPSKTVSRKHAQLYYHATEGKWHVEVFGRNGVKVNDGQLKKHEDRAIQSGDVLGIAGTQMLFQAASGKAIIHPMFIDKMLGPERLNGSEPSSGMANGEPQQLPSDTAPTAVFHQQAPNAYAPPQAMYGQMALTSAPVEYPARPVTPPPTSQRAPPSSGKRRSPGGQYRRAILMESTETIDYAADASKDLKPQCSYAAMITWAIMSSPDETLSLNGIYEWIKKHYAYYRLTPSGWQNSIRHNLSLNAAFDKVARRSDEPGKGMKWSIVPDKRADAIAAAEKNASKGGGRTSSAPGSPAGASLIGGVFPLHNPEAPPHVPQMPNGSPIRFQQQHPQYQLSSQQQPHHQQQQYRPAQTPNEQSGPTMSSFSASQPPQPPGTPTPPPGRGAQLPIYAPPNSAKFPELSGRTSPPAERSSARLPMGMDSSPTLNSRGWNSGDYLDYTPAPRAHNLNHLQPNTAHLPSKFIGGIESSPAPFFRYMGDGPGNTPGRPWNESSPAKVNGTAATNDTFPSSSPPPTANGIGAVGAESPTRRPGTSSRPASSSKPPTDTNTNTTTTITSALPTAQQIFNGDLKVEEEIDLVKGFKPISKFHEQRLASATHTAS